MLKKIDNKSEIEIKLADNLFSDIDIKKHFDDSSNDIFISEKENNSYLILWKNRNCISSPKIDFLKDLIQKFIGNSNSSIVNDIVYTLSELINNGFRSKAEYKLRSKNDCEDYYENDLNILVSKNCRKCIKVSLELVKHDNKLNFIIKSYNKITEKSIERIRERFESENIKDFENGLIDSYSSFTGKSGFGLYSIKNMLHENYDSKLEFGYNNDSIYFYFQIDEELMKSEFVIEFKNYVGGIIDLSEKVKEIENLLKNKKCEELIIDFSDISIFNSEYIVLLNNFIKHGISENKKIQLINYNETIRKNLKLAGIFDLLEYKMNSAK